MLEDLLQNYEGTVFLVSHDRRFLDNVVTSTIAYEGSPDKPGFWREYEGGVTDWITQSKRAAQINASAKPASTPAASSNAKSTNKNSPQATPDVREVIKLKAIYELLETITDKCEDVANLIEGVVLENS